MAQGVGHGMKISAVIACGRIVWIVGKIHRIVYIAARPVDCGDLAVGVVGVQGKNGRCPYFNPHVHSAPNTEPNQ